MAAEDSNTKRCSTCGEVKPLTAFSKNASNRDGLQYRCKLCVSAHYLANAEKIKARVAAWKSANPEKKRQLDMAWASTNHEKRRKHRAKWRDANPGYIAKWREANPCAAKTISQNRRARKRAVGGRLSSGLADRLFKLQRGKCACGCKQPLGTDYHLDHIMPLALGGANTDDNMQLLRKTCNLQKSAKHPVDFMQSNGFLL